MTSTAPNSSTPEDSGGGVFSDHLLRLAVLKTKEFMAAFWKIISENLKYAGLILSRYVAFGNEDDFAEQDYDTFLEKIKYGLASVLHEEVVDFKEDRIYAEVFKAFINSGNFKLSYNYKDLKFSLEDKNHFKKYIEGDNINIEIDDLSINIIDAHTTVTTVAPKIIDFIFPKNEYTKTRTFSKNNFYKAFKANEDSKDNEDSKANEDSKSKRSDMTIKDFKIKIPWLFGKVEEYTNVTFESKKKSYNHYYRIMPLLYGFLHFLPWDTVWGISHCVKTLDESVVNGVSLLLVKYLFDLFFVYSFYYRDSKKKGAFYLLKKRQYGVWALFTTFKAFLSFYYIYSAETTTTDIQPMILYTLQGLDWFTSFMRYLLTTTGDISRKEYFVYGSLSFLESMTYFSTLRILNYKRDKSRYMIYNFIFGRIPSSTEEVEYTENATALLKGTLTVENTKIEIDPNKVGTNVKTVIDAYDVLIKTQKPEGMGLSEISRIIEEDKSFPYKNKEYRTSILLLTNVHIKEYITRVQDTQLNSELTVFNYALNAFLKNDNSKKLLEVAKSYLNPENDTNTLLVLTERGSFWHFIPAFYNDSILPTIKQTLFRYMITAAQPAEKTPLEVQRKRQPVFNFSPIEVLLLKRVLFSLKSSDEEIISVKKLKMRFRSMMKHVDHIVRIPYNYNQSSLHALIAYNPLAWMVYFLQNAASGTNLRGKSHFISNLHLPQPDQIKPPIDGLFLRKEVAGNVSDMYFTKDAWIRSLDPTVQEGPVHVSTISNGKDGFSINDAYQNQSDRVFISHRLKLKIVRGEKMYALQSPVLEAMPGNTSACIVYNSFALLDRIYQPLAGFGQVCVSHLWVRTLQKMGGGLYIEDVKRLEDVIPEATFLKRCFLNIRQNVRETPEYKAVEYLLSRAYFGNLRFQIKSTDGTLTCHEMTEDVLHFLAAFFLYRKSDLFTEPVKTDAFWSEDVSGTILEKVFDAIQSKEEDAYDSYESYNSSSGVPVFGNGGNGGVTILPKEFCSEAQVVSLLRGICARYSPGARQAAAY